MARAEVMLFTARCLQHIEDLMRGVVVNRLHFRLGSVFSIMDAEQLKLEQTERRVG